MALIQRDFRKDKPKAVKIAHSEGRDNKHLLERQ